MTDPPFKFTPNPESLEKARIEASWKARTRGTYEAVFLTAYMEAELEAGRAVSTIIHGGEVHQTGKAVAFAVVPNVILGQPVLILRLPEGE